MPLFTKTDISLFVFVCISTPIYILFLLTLIVNRKKEPFNAHFFQLTISLGIADLAAVIHSYLFVRIPGWGWLWWLYIDYGHNGTFLPFYALSLQFAFAAAQHMGVLLVGLNRFSRLALEDSTYNRVRAIGILTAVIHLWSGRNFFCAIVIQWFIPIILCGSMAFQDFRYWKANFTDDYAVNIDFSDLFVQTIYYTIALCINFLINILTFASYAVIFAISLKQTIQRSKMINVYLPRSWSSQNPTNIGQGDVQGNERAPIRSIRFNYAREMKLAISGFAVFISMLVYFMFLVIVAVSENFNLVNLWYIASDMFSCINPYTLLLMSKETRRHFFNLVRCRK